MLNYIGNARIIKNLYELPRIGEIHPIYKTRICIEVKAYKFTDDYIFYQARFCEKDSLPILDDFYINCSSWTYAVNKKDIFKGA